MSRKRTAKKSEVRRRYDDELKAEAVQTLLDGHSAQSIADNLGINSPGLIYRWKSKVIRDVGPAAATLDSRVRELEEELRRTERERDILKKLRQESLGKGDFITW